MSKDSVKSHVKFKEKYDLPFPLLSDPDIVVCEKYGVMKEKNMYGKKKMGIQRSTFLIDAEGTVRKIWKRVRVDGHDEAVLAALAEL